MRAALHFAQGEMNVKVSVIMTVFNGARYLTESIPAILHQSYVNFELLIIDDASTDDSLEIIEMYAAQDSRVSVIRNRTNKGQPESRNTALRQATGGYIAVNDADDISLPDRFKLQVRYLEEHPEVFLLGGAALVRYGNYEPVLKKSVTGADENASRLPRYNHMVHSTIMFRNTGEARYRCKFLMSQDYDLYLNLLSKGYQIDNLAAPLIVYSVDDTSISSTKSRKRIFFSSHARKFYHQRRQQGKDEYHRFDPEAIINSGVDERSADPLGGLRNYINIIVYEDKKKALAVIVKNSLRLKPAYILNKVILLLTPLSVMHKLRERRRPD